MELEVERKGIPEADQRYLSSYSDEMALICPNQLVAETALVYALVLRTIFKSRDH